MAAYVIVQGTITDQEKYDQYKTLTPATVEQYGGRFLVRGGAMEHLEGEWDVARLVMLEFSDMDAARRWYASPEYQAAKAVREGAATMTFTLVDGYDS